MRTDLLKAIAASKDVTNAIILTHNIDFVFLQTVVLTAFRKCGHPSITVFADAQCAADSYAYQHPVLDGIGVRYRVVPVAMAPGFRFHAKAVLLSGVKDATLFVGSGNLTFGGWRENAEVWVRFDASRDGGSAFGEFQRYARQVLELVPLKNAISGELAESFDAATRQWVASTQGGTSPTLVGRAGSGASLLAAIRGVQGPDPVDELVVCSPFFDAEGAALKALVEQTGARRTSVLCQPARTTLNREAFAAAGSSAKLQQVSFEHLSVDGKPRAAFIHAKFYGLVQGERALVLAGSANCSRAALVAAGSAGNAELMAVQNLSRAEFERSYIDELRRVAEPVELPETAPDPDAGPAVVRLRVLAARFEAGVLLIGFAPPRAVVRACEVDGTSRRFQVAEPGVLSAVCSDEPRAVRVEATLDGLSYWSDPAWIDLEHRLRTSARGRSLVDSIRARLQPGGWNAAAWADVMDVFCKHLTYLPERDGRSPLSGPDGRDKAGQTQFSYADVFSDGYSVPPLAGLDRLVVKLDSGKERSLQQLLLRWFGATLEVEEAPGEPVPESEDEDEVDRPEALPVPVKRPPQVPITDVDQRRLQRVLLQVEEAMTTAKFLVERRPELFAVDLKVAAVLLRAGLREGWIRAPEFFRTTHRIWTSLFFAGSPELSQGWLQYRQQRAEDPTAFVAAVRSPELTAALLGWSFAATPEDPSPASARYHLAVALAVARLPWLWDAGDEAAVARELEVLLAHTALPGTTSAAAVREAWGRMVRTGHALRRLEEAATAIGPAALRERIRAPALRAGELLWQGTAGYCVVASATPRGVGQKVPVLRLQNPQENSPFMAPYTMPIEALLEVSVLPLTLEFGGEPRRVLKEFLEEIRGGLRATVSSPKAVQ